MERACFYGKISRRVIMRYKEVIGISRCVPDCLSALKGICRLKNLVIAHGASPLKHRWRILSPNNIRAVGYHVDWYCGTARGEALPRGRWSLASANLRTLFARGQPVLRRSRDGDG